MSAPEGWEGIVTEVGDGRQQWPVIPEDQYEAEIVDVGKPYEKVDSFKNETVTKMVVTFRLTADFLDEPVDIPAFPRIPNGLLPGGDGYVDERTTIFKIMKALGFDMKARPPFEPWTWVGMKCRVTTMNETKDGEETSWIESFKPLVPTRAAAPARTAAPTRNTTSRAPVGAGARAPLASRVQPEDDEE